MSSSDNQMLMYMTEDGVTRIEVYLQNDTVWLNQNQLAELFQRDRSVISKHIKNVFVEKEVDEKSNVHYLHIANSDKPVASRLSGICGVAGNKAKAYVYE
ncbi:MAG: hypothetical protein PHE41_07930 [Eubacteriales bacterium]|nr:hypothetical protein [Eubacteriales bacterium]